MRGEDPNPAGILQQHICKVADHEGQDPWRRLTATELKANTVTFPAVNDTKLIGYVQCLEKHGIQAEEILSLQVSTGGQCRLTFADKQLADQVCQHGFVINQLHIHDVPLWIAYAVVIATLSQYGTVQGQIRHGKVKVREGVHVASGVRFATFKLAGGKRIPSFVRTSDGKSTFRVFHEGQSPTCRVCDSTTHIARN
eukprot:scpid102261/ scgid28170/ 